MRRVGRVGALVALLITLLLGIASCGADHEATERSPAHGGSHSDESRNENDGSGGAANAPPPALPADVPTRSPTGPSEPPDEAAAVDALGTVDAVDAESAEVQRILALPGGTSTSLGGPNAGDLRGAVPLPLNGPCFRFNPRRSPAARFGSVELVQALVRAGAAQQNAGGGVLTVNDIGLRRGGPIPHHGSHQNGRDVDVLFYVTTPDGTPRPSVGALIDPNGEGVDFRDLSIPGDDVPVRIDLARTWGFLESLLLDPRAALQRIFVVEHVREMLLDHARANDGDAEAIRRFAERTCQPGYPHDDHFHFRFFCTAEDIAAGCRDSPPMYPWRRAELRRAGARVRMAGPERRRAPITTAAQARAEAGPLHSEVRRWLRRREAWMRRPHPGRRYCR